MIRPLLLHCLSALYPPIEGLPGFADTNPGPYVDKLLSEVPWVMWFGLVGGMAVFVLTPLITVYRPVPSFLLSTQTLDTHADRLANHPINTIRGAVLLLKLAAGMHWAGTAEIRGHFGMAPYPPDPDSWRTS